VKNAGVKSDNDTFNAWKKAPPCWAGPFLLLGSFPGISGQEISADLAKLLGWRTSGVLIAEAISGGPAHKAGLKGGTKRAQVLNLIVIIGGDLIVSLDEVEVDTMDEIIDYIDSKEVGDSVEVTYIRDNKLQVRVVVLEELPR